MRAASRRSRKSVVWRSAHGEKYRNGGLRSVFRLRRRRKSLIDTMPMAHAARQRGGLLGNGLLQFKLACHLVMEMGRGSCKGEHTVSCAIIEEDSCGFGGILGDLDGVSVSSARAAALQWMLRAHGEGCRVEGV